ncbi:MAG: adenylate/guanylate cyclase domain-containing protein [Spirochaetales bacterium]|nr:adenylate/guanylate cyclase domain-containing protein [Spirochaetales bacterium]
MNRLIYIGIGLVAGILVIILNMNTNLFDPLENMIYDSMFAMKAKDYGRDIKEDTKDDSVLIESNPDLDKNIWVVGIDEYALETFGSWPFSYNIHARFFERLIEMQPAFIFIDILFLDSSAKVNDIKVDYDEYEIQLITDENNEIDERFKTALLKAKDAGVKIFLAYPADTKVKEQEAASGDMYLHPAREKPYSIEGSDSGMIHFKTVKTPLAEFASAAWGIGTIAAEADPVDAIYRTVTFFGTYDDMTISHIVFELFLTYVDAAPGDVSIIPGKEIQVRNAHVPVYGETGEIIRRIDKDIHIPVNARCQTPINFAGRYDEFRLQLQYLSYVDVFYSDPEYLRGKALFVGPYAQGIHDIWVSPLGPMYGIEFNAHAFNTLINENFLVKIPSFLNIVIILFFTMLISFILSYIKIWQSFVLLLSFTIVFLISGCILFLNNIIMLYWTPLLAVFITYISAILYRIFIGEKEARFIRTRFANYVSPGVVDELLKNPRMLELGGEDRELTVFFSDIRGFTTISEMLGEPQVLVSLLNDYLSVMTDIIIKNSGTLDKYVGDEVMAFWGAPVYQEEHALAACRAACLQMRYLFHVLNPELVKQGRPFINIGCGINTGIMTVGNIGSKSRMDYTVIGDHVNLGARLEGLNKEYNTSIIMSEYTYRQVNDRVIARELDDIAVKGKKQAVRIYELFGITGEEDTFYQEGVSL